MPRRPSICTGFCVNMNYALTQTNQCHQRRNGRKESANQNHGPVPPSGRAPRCRWTRRRPIREPQDLRDLPGQRRHLSEPPRQGARWTLSKGAVPGAGRRTTARGSQAADFGVPADEERPSSRIIIAGDPERQKADNHWKMVDWPVETVPDTDCKLVNFANFYPPSGSESETQCHKSIQIARFYSPHPTPHVASWQKKTTNLRKKHFFNTFSRRECYL